MRCLLKNAIRYLKNAIVKLDVCSKMPLDIVIFTSNPLNMLHENKENLQVRKVLLLWKIGLP